MRTTLTCLSVRQPWAWLIVNGHKDVENRTWSTQHRGDILIHASAGRLDTWPAQSADARRHTTTEARCALRYAASAA